MEEKCGKAEAVAEPDRVAAGEPDGERQRRTLRRDAERT